MTWFHKLPFPLALFIALILICSVIFGIAALGIWVGTFVHDPTLAIVVVVVTSALALAAMAWVMHGWKPL
jgi:hypothetical protein